MENEKLSELEKRLGIVEKKLNILTKPLHEKIARTDVEHLMRLWCELYHTSIGYNYIPSWAIDVKKLRELLLNFGGDVEKASDIIRVFFTDYMENKKYEPTIMTMCSSYMINLLIRKIKKSIL